MKTKIIFYLIMSTCLLSSCGFSNANNGAKINSSSSERTSLSIQFPNPPKFVCIGNPASPIEVYLYGDSTINKSELTWTSSNPEIIAIDGPNITAVSPGESVITASYKEVSESFTATSCKPAEEVITPHQIWLDLEDTYEFVPNITPSDAYYRLLYDEKYIDIDNHTIIPKQAIESTYISVICFMGGYDSKWPYTQITETTSIHIPESLKPHFELENQTVTKTINVATPKNKYTTFDPVNYDIHAYDYFGKDITDRITISGDYSLSEKGTYNISLSVIADNEKSSTISVRLFVNDFEEERISNASVDNLLSYNFTVSTDRQGNSSYFSSVSFVANFAYKNCDALDGTVYASIEVTATPKSGGGTTTITSPIQQMICSRKHYDTREFTITCPSFYLDNNHGQYFCSTLSCKISVSFVGQAYKHVYY